MGVRQEKEEGKGCVNVIKILSHSVTYNLYMLIKPYKAPQNNSFETMSPETLPPRKLFLSGVLSQRQKPSSQEKWPLVSDWETELDNLKVLELNRVKLTAREASSNV